MSASGGGRFLRLGVAFDLVLGLLFVLVIPPSFLPAQDPCFPTVAAPPWSAIDVGAFSVGASRPADIPGVPPGTRFELCSESAGFQALRDQVRFLYMDARANFEFVARLESVGDTGLGGVMARLDPRQEGCAFAQISVVVSAAGGMTVESSYRPGEGVDAHTRDVNPVPIGLPVYLKIARIGTKVSTAYSRDGTTFTTHLEVDGEGTDLAYLFQRVGMVQSSLNPQVPSTALFSGPSLAVEEVGFPPALAGVSPSMSPLEGGIEVTVSGQRLEDTVQVDLAGVPARVLDASPDKVVVVTGKSDSLRVGAVRVVTRRGSQTLQQAFSYFGRAFIRGDFNGSGGVDISDAISALNALFLGGPGAPCPEAADTNGDGASDISDPIALLGHLFLGAPPPPAPFPLPGIGTKPSLPCGLPPDPTIDSVSADSLQEGDTFTIFGSGFSPEPDQNIVLIGDSTTEVLRATDKALDVRMLKIGAGGLFDVHVVFDPGIIVAPAFSCRLGRCGVRISSIAAIAAKAKLFLHPPTDVRVIGTSKVEPQAGILTVPVPRSAWSPSLTYEVNANLLLPAVNNLSPGIRLAAFEFGGFGRETSYESWLQELGDQLFRALSGEVPATEFRVVPDSQGERLVLSLSSDLATLAEARIPSSLIDILFRPANGTCGPSKLDPVADRRAFGWCRFGELTSECFGLPTWEYFIPKSKVFQASGDIFPLPGPDSLSPAEKGVMYNRDAYCFVRAQELWNQCKLDSLVTKGKTRIPHFPRSAIVVKTHWRSAAGLSPSPSPDTLYYHYDFGGQRWYLTALHFTTKDVDNWYWADFYVPQSAGGTGGCGGSNADRPSSITGVWTNYYMCTNLEEDEEICGNFEFPECGSSTCVGCHGPPSGSGPFGPGAFHGPLQLDFLFSVDDGPASPPGCK